MGRSDFSPWNRGTRIAGCPLVTSPMPTTSLEDREVRASLALKDARAELLDVVVSPPPGSCEGVWKIIPSLQTGVKGMHILDGPRGPAQMRASNFLEVGAPSGVSRRNGATVRVEVPFSSPD